MSYYLPVSPRVTATDYAVARAEADLAVARVPVAPYTYASTYRYAVPYVDTYSVAADAAAVAAGARAEVARVEADASVRRLRDAYYYDSVASPVASPRAYYDTVVGSPRRVYYY